MPIRAASVSARIYFSMTFSFLGGPSGPRQSQPSDNRASLALTEFKGVRYIYGKIGRLVLAHLFCPITGMPAFLIFASWRLCGIKSIARNNSQNLPIQQNNLTHHCHSSQGWNPSVFYYIHFLPLASSFCLHFSLLTS